uniref:LETM1 domain containing 1 n=1 Tax=Naja naja TaxID=35670 RepID=A0A8C6XSG6_NAJNA
MFLCELNGIKEIHDNTSAELGCPFRLPVCHFSSKANSNKLTSALVSKIKYLNHLYERYLERKFPRFYQLYSTFLKGLQIFFSEAKEIRRIKADMSNKNIQFHQLPYREMERLRQKVLSRVLFLTTRLPSFFLRNRLRSHLSEVHYLDQAMVKLGVSQLTDEEAQACYTRGLNSVHLDPEDCRLWLNQWLSLSCSLRGKTG